LGLNWRNNLGRDTYRKRYELIGLVLLSAGLATNSALIRGKEIEDYVMKRFLLLGHLHYVPLLKFQEFQQFLCLMFRPTALQYFNDVLKDETENCIGCFKLTVFIGPLLYPVSPPDWKNLMVIGSPS
jgi:hypothetical protein